MGICCIITIPPCIDCPVLYVVIIFVGLISLWFLFLTLDHVYVDAALLYLLFHCIYTLWLWLIRQVSWFIFVNGYIHVKFIIKLAFLAAWLCLTYCCCGSCRCCDEFISSSQPALIDFFFAYRSGDIFRAERLRSISLMIACCVSFDAGIPISPLRMHSSQPT